MWETTPKKKITQPHKTVFFNSLPPNHKCGRQRPKKRSHSHTKRFFFLQAVYGQINIKKRMIFWKISKPCHKCSSPHPPSLMYGSLPPAGKSNPSFILFCCPLKLLYLFLYYVYYTPNVYKLSYVSGSLSFCWRCFLQKTLKRKPFCHTILIGAKHRSLIILFAKNLTVRLLGFVPKNVSRTNCFKFFSAFGLMNRVYYNYYWAKLLLTTSIIT